jgi:hypothetical protein
VILDTAAGAPHGARYIDGAMTGRTLRWCLLSGAAGLGVVACRAYDPIVYSDRVPYEWELSTMDVDAGAGVEGGSDGGPEDLPAAAGPFGAPSPATATATPTATATATPAATATGKAAPTGR